MRSTKSAEGRLSLGALLTFSLPALPIAMMHIPVGAVIPGYYAKHTAVTLSQIGVIFLVSRIFDAVIDPGIGYLSDNTPGRLGKRKPWIAAGTAIAVVAVYALFTPGRQAGPGYLMAASMALYLGWTMLEIPYRAWSGELTRSYADRARISVCIAVMGAIGTVVFMGISLLPVFKDAAIGPDTLKAMAIVIMALLPALVGLALARIPEGRQLAPARASTLDALASVGRNAPLRLFAAAFIFGGLASGVFTAVFYVFVDSYLGLGSRFTTIYVCNAIANLAAMPLWGWLIRRTGQHRALAFSWAAIACVQLLMLAIRPGAGALGPMIAIAIAYGLGEAATKAAPYALVADIVDYEILRSRTNRAGSYFAFLTLVAKLNFAVGGGVAFLLLGWIGYRVGHPNAAAQVRGFLAVFVGLPAVLYALAAVVIWRFPLDERAQEIIRRRIERLAPAAP